MTFISIHLFIEYHLRQFQFQICVGGFLAACLHRFGRFVFLFHNRGCSFFIVGCFFCSFFFQRLGWVRFLAGGCFHKPERVCWFFKPERVWLVTIMLTHRSGWICGFDVTGCVWFLLFDSLMFKICWDLQVSRC